MNIKPEQPIREAFDQPFPLGETNDAFAQYFIGQSYNGAL